MLSVMRLLYLKKSYCITTYFILPAFLFVSLNSIANVHFSANGKFLTESSCAQNYEIELPLSVNSFGSEKIVDIVVNDSVAKVTTNPKVQTSISKSELSNDELNKQGASGTAGLKSIPGLSVVSSSEGPANIRVRGLPGGGYRYVGYMEDGLPVLPTGFYATPSSDQYFKSDLTIQTVEGIRGGNAPILLTNTPGALINNISRTGSVKQYGQLKYTTGLSQLSHRLDVNTGGQYSNNWQYNVGGFYRYDQGIVTASFPANEGGQFKFNITHLFKDNKGFIRFYGKYLNDKVSNVMKSVYAYNSKHIGESMSGYDLFTQTLMPSETQFQFTLPEGSTYTSDLSQQYHNKVIYGGLQLSLNIGQWKISNKFRYQVAKSYVVSDAITGAIPFDGTPFYYQNGAPATLKNGYYVTHAIKDVPRNDDQVIDYLSLKRVVGKHQLEIGGGLYLYNLHTEALGYSFKTEMNNQPEVIVPGNNIVANLSSKYDPSGHNIYRGLTVTSSLFVNDDIKLSDKLDLNVAARLDNQDINGKKAQFEGTSVRTGGNGFVISGMKDFKNNKTYWSATLGLNYKATNNLSAFMRATRAYNAFNIDDLGAVDVNPDNLKRRTIYAAELGSKYAKNSFRFSSSLSYTTISNLLLTVYIPSTAGSLISQSTFASSRTYSFEVESSYQILKNLRFQLTSTIQDVKFTNYKFTIRETAGPGLGGTEVDWTGNTPGSMPGAILQGSLNYDYRNMSFYVRANTTGKIYTTDAETYSLPTYTEISSGLGYKILKRIDIRAWVNNLLNSRSLTDGNTMGEQFINTSNLKVGQPMIGRTLLPRNIWLSVGYNF